MNRSIDSSAQCRSSKTSTVGCRVANATTNRRHADSASSGVSLAVGNPTSGLSALASRPASSGPTRSRRAVASRSDAVSAGSVSRIPAWAFTMSASAA
jgi:hypothetical protein